MAGKFAGFLRLAEISWIRVEKFAWKDLGRDRATGKFAYRV